MKLNTKITITYIIISTLLFSTGGIVLYNYIRREVDEKVDWKLYADKKKIIKASKDSCSHRDIRSMYQTGSMIAQRYIEINPIKNNIIYEDEIKDTLLPTFLFGEKMETPYRQLTFYTTVNNNTYQIILRKLLVEAGDLREGITNSLLYVFIALLIVMIVTNFFISKKIWSPFYKTVDKISQYNFAGNQLQKLPNTGIKEFNELNNAINNMSEQIMKDFINLKEFTENASHEIQTPLAIIKLKLELLIQSENLNKEQSLNIQSMNAAVAKLSKLNQSLILITKIENSQFINKEKIDVKSEIEKIISNYEDLIQAKNIQLKTNLDPNAVLNMDQTLAEILLSNLLTNAIKHNINKGEINIDLVNKELNISNTGNPLNCEPEKLFKRFQKIHRSSDSLGLGLSIVKSICDFYKMKISYIYQNERHFINIKL